MFILSNELNNFADVAENIKQIRFNMEEAKVKYGRENDDIKVMAVTKTVPAEKVNFAVSRGFELLGENRVQEFLQKKELYVDSVTMIQSADSIALAGEISKQAEKHGKVMDILCEVNIGGEESKSGFSPEEIYEAVPQIAEMKGVRLCGLMTIPPPGQSCVYFEKMQRIFEDLKAKNADIKLLSMGMSADYTDAVRFGTGMVRLGTALFGARSYPARSSL